MIEALKQALEALENSQRFVEASANAKMLHGWGKQLDTAEDAITSLRQAIKELESQEPVAWRFRTGTWWNREVHWRYVLSLDGTEGLRGLEPLYTYPPQRKPLTYEQIAETFCKAPRQTQNAAWFAAGVRYAEAVHGIKEES